MSSRLRNIIVIWVALLLLAIGALYWFVYIRGVSFDANVPSREETPSISTTPAEQLYQSTAYEEIRAYKALGEVGKVRELFTGLQRNYATGTPERQVIDYDFAFYVAFSTGDPSEGIAMLQTIATDTTYNELTRALAMETLGRVAFTYGNASISAKIFDREPFSALFEGSYTAAVYKLFEQAVDVYPTAIAALRTAQARSNALSAGKDTLSDEAKQTLRDEYQKYMTIADREATILAERPLYNSYLADYYSTKGATVATMYFAGESVFPEEVAELYKKSIALSQGSEQVFALFNYAVFLSKTDTSTQEEVDGLVARITETPVRTRRLFEAGIKNSLVDQKGNYADIVGLMAYSPAFKAYVEGVTKSDVAS